MKNKKDFPSILKDLRLQYGYTQQYLADLLGMAYQSYQSYERGITEPNMTNLVKLADLYDVTLDYLFGRTDI